MYNGNYNPAIILIGGRKWIFSRKVTLHPHKFPCNSYQMCCESVHGVVSSVPQIQYLDEKKQMEKILCFKYGSLPTNDDQDSLKVDDDGGGLGRTRLGRIVSAGGKQLLEKLNAARKNFPMKVFLLLLGFYTANALATILGQTGDWDVLVAGVVVAAIEGIGFLMYRKSNARSSSKLQSLVVMINYWKDGVCLGLFADAFKLGS